MSSASRPITQWRRAADGGGRAGSNDGSASADARRTDAGLGSDHGAQVLSVLQSVKGRLPMICVEQNRGFLKEFADNTPAMRGGRLTQMGEP
jgi:hypothetical protein